MDILLAILTSASWILAPLGVALRPLRTPAALVLLLTVAAAFAFALADPAPRSLAIVHTFAGYQGHDLEPSAVDYLVDQRTAPALAWPLAFAAWAVPCALGLWFRRSSPPPRTSFLWPLLLAWSACASWLWMQCAAAPAAVVQPFGLERILFPAGLLLTMLLAEQSSGLLPMLARLSVGVVAMRLPLALFSKFASDQRWGTSLDVHSIVRFLNPLTRIEVVTAADSGEQHFWLIWCEHLIVVPALFLVSYSGIGVGLYLFHRHAPHRLHRVA